MAWAIIEQRVGFQPIETVDTTQNHTLGQRVKAIDPTYGEGEFIYLPGCTNGADGAWVTFDPDDYATTALVADAVGQVAVMMSAMNSTSKWGWAQIYGVTPSSQVLTSFADGARVFCTACAGFVDDASVTGDMVNGAKGASASTARAADVSLAYPWVNDNSNSGA